jgi:hypothetical protein
MSFSPKVSMPTARTDSEELRHSGYREAEPVPLCCGYHRLGLKWLCQPFALKRSRSERLPGLLSIAGVVCPARPWASACPSAASLSRSSIPPGTARLRRHHTSPAGAMARAELVVPPTAATGRRPIPCRRRPRITRRIEAATPSFNVNWGSGACAIGRRDRCRLHPQPSAHGPAGRHADGITVPPSTSSARIRARPLAPAWMPAAGQRSISRPSAASRTGGLVFITRLQPQNSPPPADCASY